MDNEIFKGWIISSTQKMFSTWPRKLLPFSNDSRIFLHSLVIKSTLKSFLIMFWTNHFWFSFIYSKDEKECLREKNLYNTKNQVCNSQCENLERCSNKIPFVHCHKRIANTVWNLATCMFKVPKPPTPFFSKINSFHTYILHYFFYYSIVTLCPKLKRIKNQITILSLSRLHSNLFFS